MHENIHDATKCTNTLGKADMHKQQHSYPHICRRGAIHSKQAVNDRFNEQLYAVFPATHTTTAGGQVDTNESSTQAQASPYRPMRQLRCMWPVRVCRRTNTFTRLNRSVQMRLPQTPPPQPNRKSSHDARLSSHPSPEVSDSNATTSPRTCCPCSPREHCNRNTSITTNGHDLETVDWGNNGETVHIVQIRCNLQIQVSWQDFAEPLHFASFVDLRASLWRALVHI